MLEVCLVSVIYALQIQYTLNETSEKQACTPSHASCYFFAPLCLESFNCAAYFKQQCLDTRLQWSQQLCLEHTVTAIVFHLVA